MSLPATTWVRCDAPRASLSPLIAWRPFSVVRERGEAPNAGDRARSTMRLRQFSRRTEETYVGWLERARLQHARDLSAGAGCVELPGGPGRRLPNAGREWPRRWVFLATRHHVDRTTSERRRRHLHVRVIRQAVSRAVLAAGLQKRVTSDTFRHSFATHLLEDGSDIRTVQEPLDHADVSTILSYTHVLNRGPVGVRSPADRAEGLILRRPSQTWITCRAAGTSCLRVAHTAGPRQLPGLATPC